MTARGPVVRLTTRMPIVDRLIHRASMAGLRGSRLYRRATVLSRRAGDRWLEFGDGSVLQVPDNEVLADAIYAGCYEPVELSLLSRLLDPGDLACDAGANFGLFTFVMASFVGRHGSVLSWEPEPGTFRRLANSVEKAFLKQVTCFPYALGRQRGRAVLQREPDHASCRRCEVMQILRNPYIGKWKCTH